MESLLLQDRIFIFFFFKYVKPINLTWLYGKSGQSPSRACSGLSAAIVIISTFTCCSPFLRAFNSLSEMLKKSHTHCSSHTASRKANNILWHFYWPFMSTGHCPQFPMTQWIGWSAQLASTCFPPHLFSPNFSANDSKQVICVGTFCGRQLSEWACTHGAALIGVTEGQDTSLWNWTHLKTMVSIFRVISDLLLGQK